jgi:predicted transcriptional regulator
MYSMAKQTMAIRIEPEVRSALDSLAAATDRDQTWIVNQALRSYLEAYRWQIEHIQQGVREANAGKFASASEVQKVMARMRANDDSLDADRSTRSGNAARLYCRR